MLYVVLALFTMWDFYDRQGGVRPFDLIGVGILLSASVVRLCVRTTVPTPSLRGVGIILFVLLGSIVVAALGAWRNDVNIKPVSGFVAGVLVLTIFYLWRPTRDRLAMAVSIILVVHIICLGLQWSVYELLGQFLNFQAFIGGEPRAFSAIFRPTGLFLEPASYSLSMFMLLMVRRRLVEHFGALDFLTIASIVLTRSLWGIVSVSLFLFFSSVRRLRALVFLAAVVLCGLVALPDAITEAPALASVAQRLLAIGSGQDSSARGRYGALWDFGQELDAPEMWFGRGIGNDYHDYGSNGVAFLLNAGGLIIGLGLLSLLVALAQQGRRMKSLFVIGWCLTAAPLWTHMFWWTWLALLLKEDPGTRVLPEVVGPRVAAVAHSCGAGLG